MSGDRAYVLLRSGRRLDLLNPDPDSWTDEDLAVGLSRTYRWGGHSRWELPFSVAQHSLLVLAIRKGGEGPLDPGRSLRELLHDAEEGPMGFDPITPLKPHLGAGYAGIAGRLKAAVARRYGLPAWTPEEHAAHKAADRLAAASEALHVAGWREEDIADVLGLRQAPLREDPLVHPLVVRHASYLRPGTRPWEPWPADAAAHVFVDTLRALMEERRRRGLLEVLAATFSRLPESRRVHHGQGVTGDPAFDVLVRVKVGDPRAPEAEMEGVVVAGVRKPWGEWDFDGSFTLFTGGDGPSAGFATVDGRMCVTTELGI